MPKPRSKPAAPSWPADKVESWPLDRLKPYERNARTHSDAQIEQIAESIKEWGWTVPVLSTKEGRIIAGHGRVEAAKRLGLAAVPVMVAEGWTDAQVRAYTLADNRLALNAEWNDQLLQLELSSLVEAGFDLKLAGFDDGEIARAIGLHSGRDPDAAPPAPDEPSSRLGDIWICGKHRVLCGDCTSTVDVRSLLGDVVPMLMVTDPPYGVDYDPDWRNRAERKNGKPYGAKAVGKVLNDDKSDWRDAWALFPGDVAYVWHAGTMSHIVADSLVATKFSIRAQIVWVKTRHVLSRGHYHPQHEPVFYAVKDETPDDHWRFVPEHEVLEYAVKEGGTGHWAGGRKQSTVWFIEHIKSETGHGTQKPVECMRRPIENNSSPGQVVYDPFLGSGTSVIAAEMAGRACYGLELNPAYVDVIVDRWQTFTGKAATLEGDGRTFEEVKRERQKADPDSAAPGEGESREASAPAARGKSRARRAGTSAVPQ